MSAIHGLTMPKWGLSMTEGKVVTWLVDEGAEVISGVELVEIETEKILGSLEAPVSGLLRRKVAKEGDVTPVAGLLAVIADSVIPDSEIDLFIADFLARFASEETIAQDSGPAPEIVLVQGQPVRYLKRGLAGEPAVLIHGFGGDLNTWLFNHEELSGSRSVYALDLPGHGGSSKQVGGGTLGEFAKMLGDFMDALGLSEAHLVGHSMGGAVALQFALAHPGRARSLVLIASAGLGVEIDGEFIEGFIAAGRRKEIKPHLEKLFADSKRVGHQLVEDVLKYKRLDGVEAALHTVAGQFCPGGQQAVVLRDRLTRLSMPIMVTWGEKDRILPMAHAQGLPAIIRIEIFPECGHMVQMEAAAKVNRLIHSFWETADAARKKE